MLIKCRECGEKIATSAETCPKCGCRKPMPRLVKVAAWATMILCLIVFY